MANGLAATFEKFKSKGEKVEDLTLEGFSEIYRERVQLLDYPPSKRTVERYMDRIWKESVLLRDGDPDAPPRPKIQRRKRRSREAVAREKLPKNVGPRWPEPDWRKPHPEAFSILLLELGIGLRRDEADKAQWDWFMTTAAGRRFIEVRKTDFFTPKGKKRRIIPVDDAVWEALKAVAKTPGKFIVPGKEPKIYTWETTPSNSHYRCEKYHRELVWWLKRIGIGDQKPCHLLRKEFGSYVATSFGLFAAQRLLGHSSAFVTDSYYAALTNLPELRNASMLPQNAAA